MVARSDTSIAGRGGLFTAFAAMSIPHYPRLWASGLLWNLTRWSSLFLSTYLVNRLTESPFQVQIVGAAFFAPMFFGGMLGGVISDRFDRRRTILGQLLVLTPIATLMGVVVLSGRVDAWMCYPYMLAVGIGNVLDMTSRRALVYDFVGEARITNALALEMLSMTGGNMLGSLTAGTVISVLGIGEAYLIVAGCYVLSFLMLFGVKTPKVTKVLSREPLVRQLAAGFRYVRSSPALISILGVTVIMNLFFFSFMPMVPVFADRLDVGAFWAGLLASSQAAGSMVGTFLIASGLPLRRGQIYVGGALFAMSWLFVFAAAPVYPLALLALACAGAGVSGFGTMQSVLVMISASDELRGRAMGMLSMAIGVLPFAMLILGGVAQAVGASAGVMGSVVLGVIVMALWLSRRPEAPRLP